MTQELTGNTGASMAVELDLATPISSYTVRRADKTPIGAAEFVTISDVCDERIFFHTEVYQDFDRRNLVELLVNKALTDSISQNATVVPLCPMFARHLRVHGDKFSASGGIFRQSIPGDIELITRAALAAACGNISDRSAM